MSKEKILKILCIILVVVIIGVIIILLVNFTKKNNKENMTSDVISREDAIKIIKEELNLTDEVITITEDEEYYFVDIKNKNSNTTYGYYSINKKTEEIKKGSSVSSKVVE